MSKFASNLQEKPSYIFKPGDCIYWWPNNVRKPEMNRITAVVVRTEREPGGIRDHLDIWLGRNDSDKVHLIMCKPTDHCEKIETPLPPAMS